MVLCCCCCRSKQKKRRNSGEVVSVEEEEGGSDNIGLSTGGACVESPELPENPVKKSDLLKYVEDHQNDLSKYKMEFNALPGSGIKPTTVGKKNANKNRYINIVPFDENRICLKETASKKDYINASYIDGYTKPRAYIAAQGPMEITVDDFWQMIWEQGCSRIVMVTNIVEGAKDKCFKYWPDTTREKDEKTFRNVKIKLVEEKVAIDYVVRTMQMTVDDESRVVHQFHFTSWPDQDVPDTCTSILKFYDRSFHSSEEYPIIGPLLVHCSAGVGRTGTLIALDLLIQQIQDKEKETADVQKCVEKLRRQRVNMVQSTSQYVFLHHALLEYVLIGPVEIKREKFPSRYEQLQKTGDKRSHRTMSLEYSVLNAVKFKLQAHHFNLAKIEKNVPKNRSQAILAADEFMARLRNSEEDFEAYINAVYVKGLKQTMAYIATQMPLPDTLNDFWGMVYNDNSTAIVMLNEITDPTDQYFPEDGKTLKCGDLEVVNVGEIRDASIIVYNLELTLRERRHSRKHGKNRPKSTEITLNQAYDEVDAVYQHTLPLPSVELKETRKVRLIRVMDWSAESSLPKEHTTLLEVYKQVEDCRAKGNTGNVVVQCLYGAERSGLFCALMNALDKVKQDKMVDVFNAVKSVRRTRPEFIEKKEQYKYLYQLVSLYLKLIDEEREQESNEANDIYANASEKL